MTTIAYKEGVVAADRRIMDDHMRCVPMAKIHEKDGWHLAFCGAAMRVAKLVHDFDAAKVMDPDWAPVTTDDVTMIAMRPGALVEFLCSGRLEVDPHGTHAWGNGRMVAIGAMYAGASPSRAVEIASHVCPGDTGDGIDEFDLRVRRAA